MQTSIFLWETAISAGLSLQVLAAAGSATASREPGSVLCEEQWSLQDFRYLEWPLRKAAK